MKSIIRKSLLFILTTVLFTGCATVFKGYEDDVTLIGLSQNTRVYSRDNVEIPIRHNTHVTRWESPGGEVIDSIKILDNYISLRSNTDHMLIFKSQDQEQRVYVYPRLSVGWFILDCLTGTFFVDLYTGNWNHFKDIDLTKEK